MDETLDGVPSCDADGVTQVPVPSANEREVAAQEGGIEHLTAEDLKEPYFAEVGIVEFEDELAVGSVGEVEAQPIGKLGKPKAKSLLGPWLEHGFGGVHHLADAKSVVVAEVVLENAYFAAPAQHEYVSDELHGVQGIVGKSHLRQQNGCTD